MQPSAMDSAIPQLAFLTIPAIAALMACLVMWQRWRVENIKITPNSVFVPHYTSITFPILGSLQYFSSHWDFLRNATKNGSASFHLAKQKCIAVSVEKRHEFFGDSRSSTPLAYAIMLGAVPSMNKSFMTSFGFDITLGGRAPKWLMALLRPERINANMPLLCSYADEAVSGFGPTTDPFKTIYETIFRLTVNTIASSSVAASPITWPALKKIFHKLDQPGTPVMVLFPWFLGWERIRRFYLMKQFYTIMCAATDERRKEGRNEEDPLQYLIDGGLSSLEITQFTLIALFAGIANTGIVASYFLCDLATHPAYLAQIRQELEDFVSTFNPDKTLPLRTRIQSIKPEDWIAPSNLPVLNRCLKETLRLRLATPLHRLNDSGKDMELGGMLVPMGTILSFHFSFMHHNEDIYTAPLTWDPERFSDAREEDKSAPMSFAGWGLGKHTCLGQKFARFEIFLLTALMVSSYDMQAIHKDGRPMAEMPPVELNSTIISPPKQDVHLRLTPRC
ncbi:cytochrome P450 [Mycena leptocephala]|nr:cytochrome P450 [Mycena leptocephala]